MNEARMFGRGGSLLVLLTAMLLMSLQLTPIGHAHKAVFETAFFLTLGEGVLFLIASFMTRKRPF